MNDIAAAQNKAECLRALDHPTATEAAVLIEAQAEKLRFYGICMNTAGLDDMRATMRSMEVQIAELTAPRTPDAYRAPNHRGKFRSFDTGDTVTSETMAQAEPLFTGAPSSEVRPSAEEMTAQIMRALDPDQFAARD